MASAYEKKAVSTQEEDELEGLFKTFDNQYHDLQEKFTDMERKLKEFRNDKSPDEEECAKPEE
jgi:DnaJ-domain-containing protein 1